MWKTIKYSKKGKPLIDVNEQGVFYNYRKKQIKKLKLNREKYPYLCWKDGNITHYAHIEVAKAFPEICGEWFKGCQVHHKDGNPMNNEASNLIVCTKEQHLEYHRLMKIKEAKRQTIKEKKPIENVIKEYKSNGKYSIHLYCKKSKKDSNGYSPVELVVYQKGNRMSFYTGFKAQPSDFKNDIYPEGLLEYVETLKAS